MRESSCRFARNRIETGVDHLTQRGKWKEGGGEFRLVVIDQSAQRNSQRKRLEKEETNEEIIQQIK